MHAPCSRLARAVDEEDGCSSDGADDADEPVAAKLSAKAAQAMLERDERVLAQLRPGSWGPSAKTAGSEAPSLSVATQTVDLAAPGRLLAKQHGGVVLSTKATHELAHASVGRTLRSLQTGGARVVSSEGVVHTGPAITEKDVSWEVKCACCAQYKAVNQAVGSGRSVREAAEEAVRLRAQAAAALC